MLGSSCDLTFSICGMGTAVGTAGDPEPAGDYQTDFQLLPAPKLGYETWVLFMSDLVPAVLPLIMLLILLTSALHLHHGVVKEPISRSGRKGSELSQVVVALAVTGRSVSSRPTDL